ncbi:hypothetical protein ACFLYH_01750 [Candidatus Dependentiae bacterium]
MSTSFINFFLEVLFQFTVFFLLVVFLVDLFKKYVLPLLYQQIQSMKFRQKELKDKKQLLILSKNRIENEIENQQEKFFVLEKKVKDWRAFKKLNNEDKAKESHRLLDKIKSKRIMQEKSLSLLKMEEIVIPASIKLAFEKIEKEYYGDKGLELLEELVVTIDSKN